jgi:hypothetical protein
MKPPLMQGMSNDFQTPPEALSPLLSYLKNDWVVWECAEGRGNLSNALRRFGYQVIGSDILTGQDFLQWQPDEFDCIVTNPPFSIKQKFLERCYQLGKPFALLLPLTTFETEKRQRLFKKYGLEVIFLPNRINFETPSGKGSGAWFATAWFTNWLDIGKELTFSEIAAKRCSQEELGL